MDAVEVRTTPQHLGFIMDCNCSICTETKSRRSFLSPDKERFLVLCIPRDFCAPEAYGPFDHRTEAMIYMRKTCENKHQIIILRNPE